VIHDPYCVLEMICCVREGTSAVVDVCLVSTWQARGVLGVGKALLHLLIVRSVSLKLKEDYPNPTYIVFVYFLESSVYVVERWCLRRHEKWNVSSVVMSLG
jgi:hypothetical protein